MFDPHPRSVRNTNVNLLVALDALLHERSVTRAARQTGITQSSMSGTLAQLRSLLGDPLLVRVGRVMQPTPLALSVLAELRHGLDSLDRVLRGGPLFEPARSDASFTLAMSDRVEAILFREILEIVRTEAPGVTLQVLPWGMLAPPPQLATGEIDVCIGIVAPNAGESDVGHPWPSGAAPLGPGYRRQELFDSTLISVVRREHPRVRSRLTLKAFCELDHVLVTEQRAGRGIVDDALAGVGRKRRIKVRVPRHTLVGELIAGSDLVATIDRRIARSQAGRHGLRLCKPPVVLPGGRFGLVWHERTDADAAQRWLRARIESVAKRHRSG